MAINQRQYIDFKLYLTAAPEGKGVCQVAVLPTLEVGEAIMPVIVGTDNVPRVDLIANLASKSITLRDLATLGKQLAECLLPTGPVRSLFRDASRCAGENRKVRLRLIIADHALKQLPWEYSYVDLLEQGPDSMRGFLALNRVFPSCGTNHYPFLTRIPARFPEARVRCRFYCRSLPRRGRKSRPGRRN